MNKLLALGGMPGLSNKTGWRLEPLGDVCEILDNRRKPVTRRDRVAGPYPYYGATGILDHVADFIFDEPLVLVGEDGAKWGPGESSAFLATGLYWVNNHAHVIRPNRSRLLDKWLIYFLNYSDLREYVSGMTVPKLNQGILRQIPIPLPPLVEQDYMVTVLDDTLRGISAVRYSAEKCLLKLAEAFEGYRDAIFASESGGPPTRLEQFTSFRNGVNFTKSSKGKRVTIVGVKDFQNRFTVPTEDLVTVTINGDINEEDMLKAGDLLTVRSNGNPELIGRTMLAEEAFEETLHSGFTIRTRIIASSVWPRYVCHFMRSRATRKELTEGGIGTNIRSLNQGALANLVCPLPPIARQKSVASQLDKFASASERLQAVFEEKISLLDALRQSLLHKAFSGQLHKGKSKATVIPFPVKLSDISSTDLHVGVLAIAYTAHERAHKSADFGHVKAEKIAHMVEAYVGVDLGRNPVQDAAGPNDFPHLKKLEHRADRAGYLTFARQMSGGYRVTKKARFDSLVTKTRAALGDRNQDLDRLLDLMTPMTTKQAEIFATVYAAWNNLLMDGEPITDERIVHAAREDWHSDKLNIPRDKFFTAIEWIRAKGLCPEGKGKRVEARKH